MWPQVTSLYYFIDPCTTLINYFDLDLKALLNDIVIANDQLNNSKDLPEALEKMLSAIFRRKEGLLR